MRPRNRELRPWVVALGHRPPYCSNGGKHECHDRDNLVRLTFEAILARAGVDFAFWGHEHSYERSALSFPLVLQVVIFAYRMRPIFDYALLAGAPHHIITSSGGNSESDIQFLEALPRPAWVAQRESRHGYGVLSILNATTAIWRQYALPHGGDHTSHLIDEITVNSLHAPNSKLALAPSSPFTAVNITHKLHSSPDGGSCLHVSWSTHSVLPAPVTLLRTKSGAWCVPVSHETAGLVQIATFCGLSAPTKPKPWLLRVGSTWGYTSVPIDAGAAFAAAFHAHSTGR